MGELKCSSNLSGHHIFRKYQNTQIKSDSAFRTRDFRWFQSRFTFSQECAFLYSLIILFITYENYDLLMSALCTILMFAFSICMDGNLNNLLASPEKVKNKCFNNTSL